MLHTFVYLKNELAFTYLFPALSMKTAILSKKEHLLPKLELLILR